MNQSLKTILFLLFTFSGNGLFAQKQGQERIDSLQVELNKTKDNQVKAEILIEIGDTHYELSNYDKALQNYQNVLEIAKKKQFKE